MLNYDMAAGKLGNRDSKKLANNTYLIRLANGNFAVKLHNTNVVEITPDFFILNSGGWQTKTTKERLNDYSPARINQNKGIWFMRDNSLFYDGIMINESGEVKSEVKNPVNTQKVKAKVDKMVSKYIAGFIADIKANGLKVPDGGDCWFCRMFQDSKDVSHIISHFEECYYVPSLLWNALQRRGNPSFVWQMLANNPEIARTDLQHYFRQIKPLLVEYLS